MYFKKWKNFILEVAIPTVAPATTTATTATKPSPVAPQGTNGVAITDTTKLSDEELSKYLLDWNSKYSQSFKFINKLPLNISENSNLNELLTSIVEDKKSSVSSAINYIVSIFTNPKIIKQWNGKTVDITGFTSTTGSDSYNKSLSERRAKAVSNAITSVLKSKNTKLDIKFNIIGKGKNEDSLIIKNDIDLTPLQINTKYKITDETKKILNSNIEERQKINRRVEISLPNYDLGFQIPDPIKKEDPIKKPIAPTPTSLIFNYNSFILEKNAKALMEIFCKDLKNFLTSKENTIKDIYISTHTLLGTSNNPNEDVNRKSKMLAILSANRAQIIVDTIRKEIGDENIIKNITFHVYPTSHNMIKEKSVYITFEETEHMKKAKVAFDKLASEYSIIQKNDIGCMENLATYIVNKPLQDICLDDIKNSLNELTNGKDVNNIRTVPLEYYYDDLAGYDGFIKCTNERNDIKKKLINKINSWGNGNYKLEDFVFNPK
jgi:hypothetical protein